MSAEGLEAIRRRLEEMERSAGGGGDGEHREKIKDLKMSLVREGQKRAELDARLAKTKGGAPAAQQQQQGVRSRRQPQPQKHQHQHGTKKSTHRSESEEEGGSDLDEDDAEEGEEGEDDEKKARALDRNRMRRAQLQMTMSKQAVEVATKRVEYLVYVGLPIFSVLVAIIGFYASTFFPKAAPLPPMLIKQRDVEVLQWSPDMNVANEISKEDKPIVLKNTIVTQWKAFREWDIEYLRTHIKAFDEIYMQPTPGFQHFTFDKPLEKLFGLKPSFMSFETSAEEFFRIYNSTTGYLYWSGSIQEIGLEEDIKPYHQLAVDTRPASVNGWISTKGVVALCHYDTYTNFFVQLRGRKKFTLFPPSNWKNLYIFPLHHPGHRQCQVDIEVPDFRRFPLLRNAKPSEVILEEGDVLYLPPLWFHQVEALDNSVSVNVWSHSEAIQNVDQIFYLPVPFSEAWDQQQTYDATKVYITMIVEQFLGPGSTPEFVKTVLQTRFKSLSKVHLAKLAKPKEQVFCSATINEAPLRSEMKRGVIKMRQYLDPVPKELRTVKIEDYIQDLVHFVVGIERLPAFLEDCFFG